MEFNTLVQEPYLNLSGLDFFNLEIRNDNSEWDKFLEDVLLLRYINFRYSFQNRNYEFLKFFANLFEGFFLVIKSDIGCDLMHDLRMKLNNMSENTSYITEYTNIINLSRALFIYIIQLLKDKGN
jgi:hypothetical protein